MPRPLAFGNGRLQVQIDHRGNLRDLSWPIGIWNHLAGRAIRTGVWVDGTFAWLDSPGWERHHRYGWVDGMLAGQEVHEHPGLGLSLTIVEGVFADCDEFWRRIRIVNKRGTSREVRVFVAADLRIMESDIGDCVLWHPGLQGLVHYKGGVAVLISLEGADQYACGIADFGGAEGTWRDAEDGILSMNPIAQGSVDSVVGSKCAWTDQGDCCLNFSLRFCDSIDDLVLPCYPTGVFAPESCQSPELHSAIMATQISGSGAILAANDSDIMETNRANYAYCWIRDGVHVAEALTTWQAGSARGKFIEWALRLLKSRPFFLQKYRADGTFGASWHPWTHIEPIQLDETASFLSLLCSIPASDRTDEISDAIQRLASFLLDYQLNSLPRPSYDLWEETWGVHVYTACTVIKALRDAGKPVRDMERGFVEKFWAGTHFQRNLSDGRPDSSSLFVGLLGILPIQDPMVQQNARAVRESLWVHGDVGGLARYPGDYYFRRSDHHPGNPWIICTLWLAQHEARSGRFDEARSLLEWVDRHADPTGVLPEQLDPDTGAHLSVSPLTWSHAEYLATLATLRGHVRETSA